MLESLAAEGCPSDLEPFRHLCKPALMVSGEGTLEHMTTGVPVPATPRPLTHRLQAAAPCLPAQLAAALALLDQSKGAPALPTAGGLCTQPVPELAIELSQKRGCDGTRGPESGRVAMETRLLTPTSPVQAWSVLVGLKRRAGEPHPPAGLGNRVVGIGSGEGRLSEQEPPPTPGPPRDPSSVPLPGHTCRTSRTSPAPSTSKPTA